MNLATSERQLPDRLRAALDRFTGRYRELNGARNLGEYLTRDRTREDEELLTEPLLAELMERVLGFPTDAYFPQLGRSGLKPDFTPHDLVAHRFVLDAKSSTQDLASHEPQIRRYIDQRQLEYGVLFNLREVRVYRRGEAGHVPQLSFSLLSLWQVARGESLPDVAAIAGLNEFAERFAYRELGMSEKVDRIRRARSWLEREQRGEVVEIDLDFLVERLRDLSRLLQEDAAGRFDVLEQALAFNPARERALLRELELIALDLAPGTDLSALPERVIGYRDDRDLAGRVWRQYLLRVSQLALTRILLYRSWEDVEFVDSYLYDGGFDQWYAKLDEDLQRVLREAFAHGRERYHWLYGADNNYDWYRPGDEALIEVLYALVPVPLGKLDADVLGGLYESYVDEIDRDRLGQFYTPRSVVRFMLDRAGFFGPDGVFRIEGDERKPRRVLDFATGSGGFLVEAARRVIDDAGLREDDPRDSTEGLAAIVRGFHGCEISPFPYYLTEINLLLQVSRLLGRMRVAHAEVPPFVLGVVHADSLTTRRPRDDSIAGLDAESRLDRGELAPDERFGLVPLDLDKRDAFSRMREEESFDLVVGNPPYVFESNNKVLFDRLRAIPAWREDYRGKSDYLYYFLVLAAEKVAPGGRLCVITPAGWMNAGNADWLRDRLAATLRLDELYLFGSHRLFAPDRARRGERHRAPTPTVESAILVATKAQVPRGHELRVVALEDEPAAAQAISGDPEARVVDRDALLAEMADRGARRAGRRRGIHVHRMRQSELDAALPWPIKHGAKDVAAQVVAHLDSLLTGADALVEPLGERWSILRGVETAADAYTRRIQRTLPPEIKRRLELDGLKTGDPILELPAGEEQRSPWRENRQLLARSPEAPAILYGAVDETDYSNLIWIGRNDSVPEEVVETLEHLKPVLSRRAGFKGTDRRWFETHRTRSKPQLRGRKVMALYRTDRGRFALDETGEWQPSNKLTICTPREDALSVAYLCGLLNSELLDLWYGVRGKTPRDVWRNYEPKPIARIPYRHVERPATPDEAPRLRDLADALASADAARARAIAEAIAADLAEDGAVAGEAAGAVEALVRAIAANRRALLPHRELFPELGRTLKDPWRTRRPPLDRRAATQCLPAGELVSTRLDPSLEVEVATDGPLGRTEIDGNLMRFTRARRETARVAGPAERLRVLDALVAGRSLMPHELDGLLLPRDLGAFDRHAEERTREVAELLDEGRALVEAVERLVCRLYTLPPDLEAAVLAHAARRAESGVLPVE